MKKTIGIILSIISCAVLLTVSLAGFVTAMVTVIFYGIISFVPLAILAAIGAAVTVYILIKVVVEDYKTHQARFRDNSLANQNSQKELT